MSNALLLVTLSVIAGAALCAAADSTSAPTPQDGAQDSGPVLAFVPSVLPEPGTSVPIGRRPRLEAARVSEDLWICGEGRITTPLPVGYPRPTAPGAIELKSYPSVRRAEVTGKRFPDLGPNLAFFKLFRHIESRKIAMTAPVEMDYPGLGLDGSLNESSWSMAFLYREPGLGPTGGAGDVAVVDSKPTVYLAVGALGDYGVKDAVRVLATVRRALAELDGFEPAGSIRTLHYNGPDVREGRRWFEVQVPIRLKAAN